MGFPQLNNDGGKKSAKMYRLQKYIRMVAKKSAEMSPSVTYNLIV